MTVNSRNMVDDIYIAGTQASEKRIRNVASKLGRFFLHLLEMVLAMIAGMGVLYLLDFLLTPDQKHGDAP